LTTKPALIFQHGRLGPPVRVAEWLEARGLPYVVHHAGEDPPAEVTPREFSFVVSSRRRGRSGGAVPAGPWLMWHTEQAFALFDRWLAGAYD
jgi:hypothetical protein